MLKGYPKTVVTKDGTTLLLRPLERSDTEKLHAMLALIPEAEQWFLRENLTDIQLLRRWIEKLDFAYIIPIVAIKEDDGEIIGFLRLYRSQSGCARHVAHLRVTIHPQYRSQRVGSWMILDCAKFALEHGIEKLIAEFVSDVEDVAIKAARRLDFHHEAIIKDYVKDRRGEYLDLIIMVKTLYRDWSDF